MSAMINHILLYHCTQTKVREFVLASAAVASPPIVAIPWPSTDEATAAKIDFGSRILDCGFHIPHSLRALGFFLSANLIHYPCQIARHRLKHRHQTLSLTIHE